MIAYKVRATWALLLPALLLARAAASAASAAPAPCAQLAVKFAFRYQLLIGKGLGASDKWRALAMKGKVAPLTVWGARRGPAAAAAALLHAVLRYGLGYNAVLQHAPYDSCSADKSPFSLAPAAVQCGYDETALEAPLLARVAPGRKCSRSATLLLPRDVESCDLMKFVDIEKNILNFDEFSYCNLSKVHCSERAPVAVLVASEGLQTNMLTSHICNSSSALTIIHFDNTSCFHDTLQRLYDDNRNLSFLYHSQDLLMYRPGVLTVELHKSTTNNCPIIFRPDRATKIGQTMDMYHYAPQINNLIEHFCPQLKDLKDVLSNKKAKGDFDIETASCKWALQNNYTFESWINSTNIHAPAPISYNLYVYLCSNDPLNDEYKKILFSISKTMKQDYNFTVDYRTVNCNDATSMQDHLIHILTTDEWVGFMGALAWSSSAGSSNLARKANLNNVPVVLAGPAAPDIEIHSKSATVAVNGRIEDLANAYRRFLKKCNWSRVAILSDGSSYAKYFRDALLKEGEFIKTEKSITPETINYTLRCLENEYARIFIVNTKSELATKILRSASQLNMTPKNGYAWIVREWSPVEQFEWGSMTHFSLGWTWRHDADEHAGGSAMLRALWPGRVWPALAVPLAEAMLLLCYSFAKFYQFYNSNSYYMQLGKYAIEFADIYDVINVKGVSRDLKIRNGTVETYLIYVEQWHGAERTVLASWHMPGQLIEEDSDAVCGSLVLDRPPCSWRGGDSSDFVQKCYDPLMYTLLAMFILLPGVFLLARRARLRRLKRRDLQMLANLFENKESISIVHQDSLYIHKEIGMGNFGRVYLATLRRRRRRSQEKSIVVAAKALRNGSDKREYLQEARILEFLDHKNIVKFIGICVANGFRYILMEYALYGDLLNYLKSRRYLAEQRHFGTGDESEWNEACHISAEALTRLAGEAAAALEYLALRGLVHRDVRAANCLVDERRTLKLADFGMARKLCHDQQEYTTIRQALFPVLWMAPESLIYGTFSTASDIWALGMLFFELSTLGQRPYGDWSPQRVLEFVRLGGRPSLPPDMCSQTRSLLTACWQQEAAARPDAAELVRFLAREPRAVRVALLPAARDVPTTTELTGETH